MPRPIYASLDQLRGRVRAETLLNCLDWDGTGTVDEDRFRSAVANPSCEDIDRQLGGIFPGRVPFADIDADPPPPTGVQELALDLYVYRLYTLYPPRSPNVDLPAMWVKIKEDMKRLREGLDVLNQKPPDPARNTGGTVGALGDNPPVVPPEMMFEDMGDFG